MTFLALLVTDLDHTLVGDDEAMADLNQRLSNYRNVFSTKLVYATGRSPLLYRQLLLEKQLLVPDAVLTSVGTEIFYSGFDTPDPQWSKQISLGWNRDLVMSIAATLPDLRLQSDSEQRPFKVSYLLSEGLAREVLPQLHGLLQSQNLAAQILFSGCKDVDILPLNADKGSAIAYLQKQWEIRPEQTLVCGDSGNDIALFRLGLNPGQVLGIMVGNAQPELLKWHDQNPSANRYLAQKSFANGILEGLEYFGF